MAAVLTPTQHAVAGELTPSGFLAGDQDDESSPPRRRSDDPPPSIGAGVEQFRIASEAETPMSGGATPALGPDDAQLEPPSAPLADAPAVVPESG
eukprot:4204117-Alexandrium_andersonii.AAC.1